MNEYLEEWKRLDKPFYPIIDLVTSQIKKYEVNQELNTPNIYYKPKNKLDAILSKYREEKALKFSRQAYNHHKGKEKAIKLLEKAPFTKKVHLELLVHRNHREKYEEYSIYNLKEAEELEKDGDQSKDHVLSNQLYLAAASIYSLNYFYEHSIRCYKKVRREI